MFAFLASSMSMLANYGNFMQAAKAKAKAGRQRPMSSGSRAREFCGRCGRAKERPAGCGCDYCLSCGDRENAVIASDLRRRQRRRRELKELLPELFRAYHVPPDVVGVVLRFVGYDLPGTARLPDRDNHLKQHLSRITNDGRRRRR